MEQNKKLIILGISILVVVLVWARALRSPVPKEAVIRPPTVASAPAKSAKKERKIDLKQPQLKKQRMALKWGRNPFVATATKEGALSLTGVMYDEKEPMALINDVVLKVGDTIQGKKIIEIKETEVILEEDGERFILKLGVE